MNKKSLYQKGKKNEIRIWSVWTENENIYTEFGVLNGEMQVSVKKAQAKNVGKSNETSAIQQAEIEAEALYVFKKDRKYFETKEEAENGKVILPMLAKEIDKKKIAYPCLVQPKLDGVRCLAYRENNKIKLLSRGGKEWTVPNHINFQLESLLPKDCMFDGELYVHGKNFDTITTYVNKWRPETSQVVYHIYDMPIARGESLTNEKRHEELAKVFKSTDASIHKNICQVETRLVSSYEEIETLANSYTASGYEGAIVRNLKGIYVFAHRSSDLMKVKTFEDAEFVVKSITEGIGKFEGSAIFELQNDLNDSTFSCIIACTAEERKKYFSEKEKYIGEKLTVKFQGRTQYGIPRIPTGKGFRPKEDL